MSPNLAEKHGGYLQFLGWTETRQRGQQIFGGSMGVFRVRRYGSGEGAFIYPHRTGVEPLAANVAVPRVHLFASDAVNARLLQRTGNLYHGVPFLHFGPYQQRDRSGNNGSPRGVLGRRGRRAAFRAFLFCE